MSLPAWISAPSDIRPSICSSSHSRLAARLHRASCASDRTDRPPRSLTWRCRKCPVVHHSKIGGQCLLWVKSPHYRAAALMSASPPTSRPRQNGFNATLCASSGLLQCSKMAPPECAPLWRGSNGRRCCGRRAPAVVGWLRLAITRPLYTRRSGGAHRKRHDPAAAVQPRRCGRYVAPNTSHGWAGVELPRCMPARFKGRGGKCQVENHPAGRARPDHAGMTGYGKKLSGKLFPTVTNKNESQRWGRSGFQAAPHSLVPLPISVMTGSGRGAPRGRICRSASSDQVLPWPLSARSKPFPDQY